MLKIDYKNPMTKLFQYEYTLYMLASDLFAAVRCRSLLVERLRLYYMDLVKVSRHAESASYEKQYQMEEEMQRLISRDVVGKVAFPGMHICHAELTIRTLRDGSHAFEFSDGIYGFALHLKMDAKGHCAGIEVRNFG